MLRRQSHEFEAIIALGNFWSQQQGKYRASLFPSVFWFVCFVFVFFFFEDSDANARRVTVRTARFEIPRVSSLARLVILSVTVEGLSMD